MREDNAQLPPEPILLQAIETDLQAFIRLLDGSLYQPIREMITYHFGWFDDQVQNRGKRLRPLLTLHACHSVGGQWESALPAAVSVELIHNFSLIHDDIQDKSEIRRGRPTIWKRWGIPQAINTGDALFVLARIALHKMEDLEITPSQCNQVRRILDQACLQLTKGQHLDLAFVEQESVTEAEYLEMIEGKTAALIAASLAAGAVVGQTTGAVRNALHQFGRHLGLAFQISDDILGIWGKEERTGKPIGDDLRERKKTLPVVYGLQRSSTFRGLWHSTKTDANTIHTMTTSLEACGALEAAQEIAQQHTQESLTALRQIQANHVKTDSLSKISLQLLNRQS